MYRIFFYEIKRLLWNRFAAGLLIITGFYSYWVLRGEIIMGIANTAPFSPWSYGVYFARLLPLLLTALLFFLSVLNSRQERDVRSLTIAAVAPGQYLMTRYLAIILSFFLFSLIPAVCGIWYYETIFHQSNIQNIIVPYISTVFPAFLFVMGAGCMAGRIHGNLVFALIPLLLILSAASHPVAFDLYGAGWMSEYPLRLESQDPAFYIPAEAAAAKIGYCAAGLLLIFGSCILKRPKGLQTI